MRLFGLSGQIWGARPLQNEATPPPNSTENVESVADLTATGHEVLQTLSHQSTDHLGSQDPGTSEVRAHAEESTPRRVRALINPWGTLRPMPPEGWKSAVSTLGRRPRDPVIPRSPSRDSSCVTNQSNDPVSGPPTSPIVGSSYAESLSEQTSVKRQRGGGSRFVESMFPAVPTTLNSKNEETKSGDIMNQDRHAPVFRQGSWGPSFGVLPNRLGSVYRGRRRAREVRAQLTRKAFITSHVMPTETLGARADEGNLGIASILGGVLWERVNKIELDQHNKAEQVATARLQRLHRLRSETLLALKGAREARLDVTRSAESALKAGGMSGMAKLREIFSGLAPLAARFKNETRELCIQSTGCGMPIYLLWRCFNLGNLNITLFQVCHLFGKQDHVCTDLIC
ncbi:unnamed protein product [Choristocarpus tenellus]